MIKFQFAGEVNHLELDPVAHAPALGEAGIARYRARLDEIGEELGPEPTEAEEHGVWERRLRDPESWERLADRRIARSALDWNLRRLAVLDRDVEAIIRTHARDRKVAAWLTETAEAFEEIGELEASSGSESVRTRPASRQVEVLRLPQRGRDVRRAPRHTCLRVGRQDSPVPIRVPLMQLVSGFEPRLRDEPRVDVVADDYPDGAGLAAAPGDETGAHDRTSSRRPRRRHGPRSRRQERPRREGRARPLDGRWPAQRPGPRSRPPPALH